MWPKVLAQLLDLLPHVSRLLPMADKFLTSKTAGEKANEAALAALAEDVRGGLGQVTAAHAGLYRKLQEQSAQIDAASEELKRARLSIEQIELRLVSLETRIASVVLWIKLGIPALLLLAIAILVLLLQLRSR